MGVVLRTIAIIILSAVLCPVFAGCDYSPSRIIFSEYMTDVHNKIQKNWNPPDFLIDGHALATFKIDRFGNVIETDIIESSHDDVYDESVIEAIKNSSPFNKFPEETTRNSITIRYSFDTSLVKTDAMRDFVEQSDRYFGVNNELALKNINLAIEEVHGDLGTYFLYGKRGKIKQALGDNVGAKADFAECERLKKFYDKKRINMCKLIVETEPSPFAYFYLARAYEIAEDYTNAIGAIDKAISMTKLNNNYKRYRDELVSKQNF